MSRDVGLKVHFSVNAKWQFVYTVRLAPSRSDAPVAVSLKLRVYREYLYLYLYLNSPILMPAACDCLKNVHRMSAIYLLHLLIFLSRCLQLGFRFLVFFSSILFLLIYPEVFFRFAIQIVKVPKRQTLFGLQIHFLRGRGPHINIHLHECSSRIKMRGDFLRLS